MRRSLVLVSVALTLAACGARTELPALGDTSGLGAGGGGGGRAIPCGQLVVDGPRIEDTSAPSGLSGEHEAALVAADDTRVILFHTSSNDILEHELRATTFDAWGVWPASQGAPVHLAGAIREGTVATRGLGADAAALLGRDAPGAPGKFAFLAPSILPAMDGSELTGLSFDLSKELGRPASIAAGGGRFFLGYRVSVVEELTQLVQVVVDAAGNVVTGPRVDAGCAAGPGMAAALDVGGGFLSAFSTGSEWGLCLNEGTVPGPPTRVQVERWTDGFLAIASERVGPEPIANLALALRPGGAWLVTHTDGSTSFQPPPVLATPLDTSGEIAGPDIVLVPEGRSITRVAVTALGARLAVAWGEAGMQRIEVRVFSPDGELEAEASVDTPNSIPPFERLSLVASPAGDALVVAWTDFLEGAKTAAARLACRAP